MTKNTGEKIERLIDANINRLKEGIRVVEDIERYIHNHKESASYLKRLRHMIQPLYSKKRLLHRDPQNDMLKQNTVSELKRGCIDDIAIANFSRAQEAARVLEESYKITNLDHSARCKEIRYALYEAEKNYFSS